MSAQSPIFVKTEAFMVWLFNHTRKFPNYERFRLAKQIEDALFNFHECLMAASYQKTKEHLQEADFELSKLRTYLRLSMELHHTSHEQFGYASQQLTEIGKLLGGWMKTWHKQA